MTRRELVWDHVKHPLLWLEIYRNRRRLFGHYWLLANVPHKAKLV